MTRKTLQRAYSDGIMYIYERKNNNNPKSREDLSYKGKLCFDYRDIRQEDNEFAEQLGKRLTLKVSTPMNKAVTANHLAVIEDTLYAIIQIDPDRARKELYFYLTEVRSLA